MKLNDITKNYFSNMLKQMNSNKLSEDDMYQLFQDMVNSGYVWSFPELSLHARMLIEKGCLTTPKDYVHTPVSAEEILKIQESRQTSGELQ